jgi:hypothetical protein
VSKFALLQNLCLIQRFCPEAWLIEEMVTLLLKLGDKRPYIAQLAQPRMNVPFLDALRLCVVYKQQAPMAKASITMQCGTIKQFDFRQN